MGELGQKPYEDQAKVINQKHLDERAECKAHQEAAMQQQAKVWFPLIDAMLVLMVDCGWQLLAPGYDDIFVSGPLVGEGVCALRDQPTLLFEGTNELLKSVGALDLCTTDEFRNHKSHNQEGCVS